MAELKEVKFVVDDFDFVKLPSSTKDGKFRDTFKLKTFVDDFEWLYSFRRINILRRDGPKSVYWKIEKLVMLIDFRSRIYASTVTRQLHGFNEIKSTVGTL